MLPELLKEDKHACLQRVFPDFKVTFIYSLNNLNKIKNFFLKEVCLVEDLNRTQEFYLVLNDCLLNILSSQLVSSKEFAFHFIDLVLNKVYLYCEKPTDYGKYFAY